MTDLVDFARANYAEVLTTEGGYAVADLNLTRLRLDKGGTCTLVAKRVINSIQPMHPRERDLFFADMLHAGHAIEQVGGAVTYLIQGEPQLHIVITPATPLSTHSTTVGDLREALGYIRQWVADPLLTSYLDHQGRVIDWPPLKREDSQQAVRLYLVAKFEQGRRYTEAEVNALLNQWATFEDWALLRRELIMHALLERTRDGSAYWRIG